MNGLYINKSNKTPEVNFKYTGLIELRGNSFLENTREFYEPLIEWLQNYVINPAEKTIVNFDFEYYNTSSQLWIFRVVEVLLDLVKVEKDIVFNWYFTEEEVEEAGMDLANLLAVDMNFIKKEEAID